MSKKNKILALAAASAFSLAIATALQWLIRKGFDHWTDAAAGWAFSLAILGFVHLLLAQSRAQTDAPSPMRSLALIGVRLFALIISIVIVLVGGFFEAAPFVLGLCAAYFSWSWTEIALLKDVSS